MYRHILKKDLMRKKTTNTILLLFVILATMFVSGSVNDISCCLNGIAYFFEQAGAGDYVVLHRGDTQAAEALRLRLSEQGITDCRMDEGCLMSGDWVCTDSGAAEDFPGASVLMPVSHSSLTIFDMHDRPVTDVEQGTVRMAAWVLDSLHAAPGDRMTLRLPDGTAVQLQIAEPVKDALFGSPLLPNGRLLLHEADYAALTGHACFDGQQMRIVHITTADTAMVETAIRDVSGILLAKPAAFLRQLYIVDMFVAAIFLVVSICLILIAVVVLKFTISFTLTEEFREIGVMKAIGLRNDRIRTLYLVKYLAIAVVGSLLGFLAGIPFGGMMKSRISEKIVLGSSGGLWLNAGSAVLVVLTVLLFCRLSTAPVKKFTPLDAIRAGGTGVRYGKKRGIRLGQTRLSAAAFTAVNDVLSAPGRYLTLILTFVLCLSLVLVLGITADTVSGDAMLPLFQTAPCDVYVTLPASAEAQILGGGEAVLRAELAAMQQRLAEQGIPAETFAEVQYTCTIRYEDRRLSERCMKSVGGIDTDAFAYLKGTPPQNAHEIALSVMCAERLGAGIGDLVQLSTQTGEERCLVTALFATVNNLGEAARLHPDIGAELPQLSVVFPVQVRYTDQPDARTAAERLYLLRDMFGEKQVLTPAQFCADHIGAGDLMDTLKQLVLLLAMVIVALVTVLMERSFIAKERHEIALLKAIGFPNRAVRSIHTLRFVVVSAAAAVISDILALPLTRLCITPVFRTLGAVSVQFAVDPLMTFLVYPAAVIVTAALAARLTSLSIGAVEASDTANIE